MRVYITNDYNVINLEDVTRIAPGFINGYHIQVSFRSGDNVFVDNYKNRQEVYNTIKEIYEKMNQTSPL